MESSNKVVRVLAVPLFIFGVLLTLALAIIAFWPDLEASLFDTTSSADESLDSLRCPLILTASDSAHIKASFTNPLERETQLFVRARISEGHLTLMREVNARLPLAVGETRELEFPVAVDDAAYRRVVLARVYVNRSLGQPSRQESCGILALNITGIRGNQVVALMLVTGLLSLGAGGLLWLRNERPLLGRKRALTRAFGILALLILVDLAVGMLGYWAVSVFLLAIVTLFILAMIERFLLSGRITMR